VVAASAGYPGEVRKGLELTGDVWGTDEAVVFHAGTRCEGERIVASGGRVLGVTGVGSTLALARDRAYRALERVRFEGMQFRTDIGARGLGGPAGES
jgi:phosphoribosylamine--glycine ligase